MAAISAVRGPVSRVVTAMGPRMALARPAQRSAFSTSKAVLDAAPNGNPSYPAFNLRHLSPNPRTRFWLAAGLLGLGFVEGAAWVKFWPKISGQEQENKA